MTESLERVRILNNIGRYNECEHEIQQYLSENPDDSEAYELLSICLYNLSKYDLAIEAIRKAVELDPQAEEYFTEALSINPEYVDGYASLAELYWIQGQIFYQTKKPKPEFFLKGVDWANKGLEVDSQHGNSICF
jgi:tetratricopeptide (TPR) repeat protein